MKKKSKQKFKPLSEATTGELREAMKLASLWLTDVLEDCTEFGAFSEANLGEPAVEYFPKRAYLTLKDPKSKWHWKEGTKLSTLMINVIKSDMAHVMRDYVADGSPIVNANSELERVGADEDGWDDSNDVLEIDPEGFRIQGSWTGQAAEPSASFMSDYEQQQEKLAELERYESRRDAGYHIARQAAKGNSQFEKYVEAVFNLPDQRSICKRMKMTKAEVEALEAELIVKIKLVMAK